MESIELVFKALPFLVPSLTPLVAFIGSARLVMKPLMTWVLSIIRSSETKDDDIFLGMKIRRVISHPAGRIIAYLLFDLVLSINLRALADELAPKEA